MDIRTGPELGMKSVSREVIKKFKPVAAEDHLAPAKTLVNKQLDQVQKDITSIRVSQTRDAYQVKGNSVNFMA